jgi:hypothetical protein
MLIYKTKNLIPYGLETETLSSCPKVPKCVNANYNNIEWPWTGCAVNYTNKNGIVTSPKNWVHTAPDENNNVSEVRCPTTANGEIMGAFPYLIVDLPGTPEENAKPGNIDLDNPPCMYELDQMCGYANKYDKHGNVIVGTTKNPPKCGSMDKATSIIQNKHVLACLSEQWVNPDLNSINDFNITAKLGEQAYYVSN